MRCIKTKTVGVLLCLTMQVNTGSFGISPWPIYRFERLMFLTTVPRLLSVNECSVLEETVGSVVIRCANVPFEMRQTAIELPLKTLLSSL